MTIKPDDTSNRSHLYPNGEYGFYVFNTKADQVSGARMTFTYPVSLGQLKWTAATDNGAWAVPNLLSTDGKVNTYQSCYGGSFADHTYSDPKNNSSYYADVTSYPSFTAPISTCPSPLTIEVTRTVVVKNKGTLTFNRTVQINAQALAPAASGVGG